MESIISVSDIQSDPNILILYAVRTNNKHHIQTLIRQGINIDKTILWILKNKYATHENLSYFIEKSNNLNITDNQGKTPLYYAILHKYINIAYLLIDYGVDVNIGKPIFYAIRYGLFELVQKLILRGADVNIEKLDGYTPLMEAISLNNIKITRLLIDSGAIINVSIYNNYTPLIFSVINKNINIIQLLLEKNKHKYIRQLDCKNALQFAYTNEMYATKYELQSIIHLLKNYIVI
tara:strand:+ start:1465 stop:2169 length:705 start_codon:yes stop_codon:yes gene_type:complete